MPEYEPMKDYDGAITLSGNCGLCGDSSCLDRTVTRRPDAASILRGRGWVLTLEYGWLCARCYGKETNGSPAHNLTVKPKGPG